MRFRVWGLGLSSLLLGLAGCASGNGSGGDEWPIMAAGGFAGQVSGASGGTAPGAGGFNSAGGFGPMGGAPPLGGTAGVPMGGTAGVAMGAGGTPPPPGTGGAPPVNV